MKFENGNMNSDDRLIVALDLPDTKLAEDLTKKLGSCVSFYKIGLSLIPLGGFYLAERLKEKEKKVFLDLKLYDIGKTVENTVKNLNHMDLDFLTVQGDPQIVDAAANGRKNNKLKILAVTFLTNFNRLDLDKALVKKGRISDLVVERARRAFASGADGVVASALEANSIRKLDEAFGKIIVTPGIRLTEINEDDQKRIANPSCALRNGADFIVVGRPIYESDQPRKKVHEIVKEIGIVPIKQYGSRN